MTGLLQPNSTTNQIKPAVGGESPELIENAIDAVIIAADADASGLLAGMVSQLSCRCDRYQGVAEYEKSIAAATQRDGRQGTEPPALAGSQGAFASPACIVIAGTPGEITADGTLAKLAALLPGVPLLAYSSAPSVREAINAMRSGLSDILVEGDSSETLLNALSEAVASGKEARQQTAERIKLSQFLATLTPAEEQVLEAMLEGMANKQIAQALEIGLRTVELRRSKIMRKMQAKSLAELVKLVCMARGVVKVAG